MALVPFTEQQYLTEARDRITQQFVDKDIIDRYLQLLLDQQESIQQVFKDLLQKRSIDEATGATLDIIEEIVGQQRELISVAFVNFLFGTSTTAIIAEGDAEYTVLFGRELSAFEQVLLNYVSNSQGYPSRLIPKTVGVRINFGYFLDDNYFGFQGAPGAKGFGDIVELTDAVENADERLSLDFENDEYKAWSTTYGYGVSYGEY